MTDQAMLAAAWWQIGASIAAIVLALLGIGLAYRAAADQRANRAFPSDRAHAEDFAETIKEISGAEILASEFERKHWLGVLNRACTRYNETVSNAGAAFGGYFSSIEQEIRAIAERQEQATANIPRETAIVLVDFHLGTIRDNARNWVYPEQRVGLLTHIFEQRLDEMEAASSTSVTNRKLTLKRWLIQADPSYSGVIQGMRVRWIMWRFFLDDVLHGRLGARLKERRTARHIRRQFETTQKSSRKSKT